MVSLLQQHDNVGLRSLVSSTTWEATLLTNPDKNRISILLSKVGQALYPLQADEIGLTYGSMGTKSAPITCSICLSIEKMNVDAVEVLINLKRYLRPYSKSSLMQTKLRLSISKTYSFEDLFEDRWGRRVITSLWMR